MRIGLAGLVDDMADAITRMEGSHCRRNNPGNLRRWGDLPTQGGFAVFPTCEAGRAALERQIELNINRGLTLEEFFGGRPGVYPGYAPAGDANDPSHYARNVSSWTGIPLGIPLYTLQSTSNAVFDSGDTQQALIAAGIIGALAIAFL